MSSGVPLESPSRRYFLFRDFFRMLGFFHEFQEGIFVLFHDLPMIFLEILSKTSTGIFLEILP